MAARLREQLKAGHYDELSLPALAEAIDRNLKSVVNDQHMMLMYSESPLPRDMGSTASIIDPPADPAEAQYRNHAVSKIERLAGNVGYLQLKFFFPPALSRDTIAAAMNALSSTDALIVDLRDNIGGHPGTVALLCSYFFEQRTHLNDIVDRRKQQTTSFWTDPSVPGKRYMDKPVYILVSSESFSAAEEFAYDLQVLKRAIIVGETTAGAANPSIPFRLDDHLVFYVPTGRAVNPVTRANWEAIGVKPDIAIASRDALRKAHVMALEALLAKSPNYAKNDERTQALDQARAAVER